MQGLILAAGMGRRLGELTKNNPKCMVKVNGVTLIERMLRQLEALHLSRIVIVVGYRGQQLIELGGPLEGEPVVRQASCVIGGEELRGAGQAARVARVDPVCGHACHSGVAPGAREARA